MEVRNIATGNARVGVQAGQIFGGVTIGRDARRPVDLAGELAKLSAGLKQADRDGRLDEETYAAAESELASAVEHLHEGAAQSRKVLVVTLKKLHGLVIDVPGLARRVEAVVAVVKVAP